MPADDGNRRSRPTPPDPSGIDEPHDVLAAEEFAMPARERGPAPPDPSGIDKPHDVLAAEEFAMPAGDGAPSAAAEAGGGERWMRTAALLTLAAIVAVLVRRR